MMELENKLNEVTAKKSDKSTKLIRMDRVLLAKKKSWVILVWALIVTVFYCFCCHQVIRPVEAANQYTSASKHQHQQSIQTRNDFDQRNIQIPIAPQQEATKTEKVASIVKNASLIGTTNDDLLTAASSTVATSTVVAGNSAPVQQRQLAASGGGLESRGFANVRLSSDAAATAPTTTTTTTVTSADSGLSSVAATTTEGNKRRLVAAGGIKLTQLTPQSTNQQVVMGSKQHQKQNTNTNEPQSRRLLTTAGNDNRQQSTGAELIERMSTSQSIRFAEPSMELASNGISRQQSFMKSSNHEQYSMSDAPTTSATPVVASSTVSNRWTHFGARLKPLATTHAQQNRQMTDHYEGAPNSPAYLKVHRSGSQVPASRRTATSSAVVAASVAKSGNELTADDDQDDADDDQDSEALLYKMMQQPNFLMSPNWQEQQLAVGGNQKQSRKQLASDPQQQHQQPQQQNPAAQVMGEKDSKRVIKLLKSYSHIHQVDDSGDQIRGTYTRFASKRKQQPASAEDRSHQHWKATQTGRGASRQQQQSQESRLRSSQQQNRQRPTANVHQQQPRVESSNQSDEGEDDGNQLTPSTANENQGAASNGQEVGSSEPEAQGPPAEDEFECPNNGIFADEASGCQSYHVCQAGAQVQEKFQCPMGTLFNNIILTCDFAHNVQCHGAAAKKAAAAAAAGSQEVPDTNNEPAWTPPRPSTSAPPPASQRRQQSQGPRRLQIGQSQYNQLSTSTGNPMDQAVSAYPPTASSEEPSNANEESNNDENDSGNDEALPEPMRPVQVPQSRPRYKAAAARNQLPYNQPPQPMYDEMGGRQIGTEATPSFTDGNIGEHYASASGGSQAQANLAIASQNDQAQNFNLVINHGPPTRASPPKPQIKPNEGFDQQLNNNYLVASGSIGPKPANHHHQQSLMDKPQHHQASSYSITGNNNNNKISREPSISANNQAVPRRQPQHQVTRHLSSNSNSSPSGSNLVPSNKPPVVNQRGANYESQRHLQQATSHKQRAAASQIKPAKQQQQLQQSARPVLLDLTSDRGQQGISSEAMNDGLLLLLRHDSTGGAQSLQPPTNNYYTRDQGNNGQYAASASSHRATTVSGATTAGKAVAVAPMLVRSDSPVDAQLFPNVQRALAEARGQQTNHGSAAAASVQVTQTATPPAVGSPSTPGINGIRVLGPLPPMEPPKPTVNDKQGKPQPAQFSSSQQQNSQGQNDKKVSTSSKYHSKQQQQQPSQTQKPIKKTKRVKAIPSSAKQDNYKEQSGQLLGSSSEKQITKVSVSTSKPQNSASPTTQASNVTTANAMTSSSSSSKRPQQQV